MPATDLAASIVSMRPFLPARDYAECLRFYQALGFTATPLGAGMAHLQFGESPRECAFLLQDFYVREFAENLMMHLMVGDLDAWWRHIEALSLDQQFGVQKPRPPKLESWGLRVVYVWDPSGVLWHFAQEA